LAKVGFMKKKTTKNKGLTILGKDAAPSRKLESFPNRTPNRYYIVTLETDEFTCKCPVTGQPDFATIRIEYIPDKKIVESKSLKLYFWSFRNKGVFHEHVVNMMLTDFLKAVDPHWCRITGQFKIRGGITISVFAEDTKTEDARLSMGI